VGGTQKPSQRGNGTLESRNLKLIKKSPSKNRETISGKGFIDTGPKPEIDRSKIISRVESRTPGFLAVIICWKFADRVSGLLRKKPLRADL
jgi:hypothetical protein